MMNVEIESADREVRDGRPHWQLGARLSKLLQEEARPRNVYAVLSAANCHGCDVLEGQLSRHGDCLGGSTAVIKGIGGDFASGEYVRDIAIGHATFSGPGVPFGILLEVKDDNRLDFRGLTLGPLSEPVPAAIDALLSGRSQWVPEAAGITITACVGGLCLPLNAGNEFRAPFSILLAE